MFMSYSHRVAPSHASKKAVNLAVNSALLEESREFRLNLSKILENSLVDALRQVRREKWLNDNQEAIKAHNERVSKEGMFGDSFRNF